MLIRLVRMTFHPDRVKNFLPIFEEAAPHIRRFNGCLHLELWRDALYPNILTTHSHWTDKDALEAYRKSPLFATTWAKTTPLFVAPPLALSHFPMREEE